MKKLFKRHHLDQTEAGPKTDKNLVLSQKGLNYNSLLRMLMKHQNIEATPRQAIL